MFIANKHTRIGNEVNATISVFSFFSFFCFLHYPLSAFRGTSGILLGVYNKRIIRATVMLIEVELLCS